MTDIPAGRVYTVEPDMPGPKTPCHCNVCGWRGLLSGLASIVDCILISGDIVPAGRCPKCDAIAYVENDPADRLKAMMAAAMSLKIDAKSLNDAYQRRIEHIIDLGMGEKP